ncbi:MAG: hypothetical protein WCK33_02850, partial [Phycisphaerae bacterium]
MRVLIVADELFASRERSLLTRLEVGLADEGVRVVYAVPQRVIDSTPGGAAELSGVFTRVVTYNAPGLAIGRRLAALELERKLADLPGDLDAVDVVHVFGGAAWRLASMIADHVNAPMAVEVWRAGMAEAARSLVSEARAAERTLFIAADPLIERELLASAGPVSRTGQSLSLRTRCIPWGVLASTERRPRDTGAGTSSPASIMMIGSGRDAAAWRAALKGCAQAVTSGLDLLIFADALAARRSELWTCARELGMLDRLSLIDDLESRRDLVLHGHVLMLPEARGEQHCITLESMASELIVISATDPHSTLLQPGRTCACLDPSSAAHWSDVLVRLLRDHAAAATLTESARLHVQVHRKASDQVRGVLAAYADLT